MIEVYEKLNRETVRAAVAEEKQRQQQMKLKLNREIARAAAAEEKQRQQLAEFKVK
jgi:hypothetical protein